MTENKQPKRPPGLEAAIQELKAEAKQTVIERSTVQFRLDPANMERLLDTANRFKAGFGVLARSWTIERLDREYENQQSSSDTTELKERISALEQSLQETNKSLHETNTLLRQLLIEKQQAVARGWLAGRVRSPNQAPRTDWYQASSLSIIESQPTQLWSELGDLVGQADRLPTSSDKDSRADKVLRLPESP